MYLECDVSDDQHDISSTFTYTSSVSALHTPLHPESFWRHATQGKLLFCWERYRRDTITRRSFNAPERGADTARTQMGGRPLLIRGGPPASSAVCSARFSIYLSIPSELAQRTCATQRTYAAREARSCRRSFWHTPPSRMPNDSRLSILLVVADDLRPELGVQGYNVSTPHLDALASRGVRLALAYSSWPVCAPSRASLFTSRTPDSLGVYHCCHCWSDTSGRRPTLFKIFRDAGYRTAAYGKVYGPDPGCAALSSELSTPHAALWGGGARGEAKAPGCKVSRVSFGMPTPLTHATPLLTLIQVGWQKVSACEVSDEATEPDPGIVAAAAERVRAWSTTADVDRPWLVYAGLRRPHLPCNAPAAHFARYPAASAELATPTERAWLVGGLDWDSSGELRGGMVRHAIESWRRQSRHLRPSRLHSCTAGYWAAA